MQTWNEAVVRIERIVEDVEDAIASHAHECVVPVASAASALMMVGCLSTTDPETLGCRCGPGGSGGDRPDEAPVATQMADFVVDSPDEVSVMSPTPLELDADAPEQAETTRASAAVAETDDEPADQRPWWRRGRRPALEEHPERVLPHLRPPTNMPSWITPTY